MAVLTFDFRALVLAAILTTGNIILCNSAETTSSTTPESTTSGGIIERLIPSCLLDHDSVSVVMYSRDYPQGKNLNLTDTKIGLNPGSPVILGVHGFDSSPNSSTFAPLSLKLAKTYNQNILVFNWSDQACAGGPTVGDILAYPQAVENVRGVGYMLGDYIMDVLKQHNRTPKDTIIIGHSLGAHAAGYAGKLIKNVTKEPVGLIMGLDPAKPGFATNPCNDRLCKTDALFTTVFRTSALGATQDDGINVYTFNGGIQQPGCGVNVACSHSRSIEYLTHSLDPDCEFIGRPRGSLGILPIPVSQCTPEICSPAGLYSYKYPARGDFAVTTSSTAPYCQSHQSLN